MKMEWKSKEIDQNLIKLVFYEKEKEVCENLQCIVNIGLLFELK